MRNNNFLYVYVFISKTELTILTINGKHLVYSLRSEKTHKFARLLNYNVLNMAKMNGCDELRNRRLKYQVAILLR